MASDTGQEGQGLKGRASRGISSGLASTSKGPENTSADPMLRVGLRVGRLRVGRRRGLRVGLRVGRRVGLRVGLRVGQRRGLRVGLRVRRRGGLRVGLRVGRRGGLVGGDVGSGVAPPPNSVNSDGDDAIRGDDDDDDDLES